MGADAARGPFLDRMRAPSGRPTPGDSSLDADGSGASITTCKPPVEFTDGTGGPTGGPSGWKGIASFTRLTGMTDPVPVHPPRGFRGDLIDSAWDELRELAHRELKSSGAPGAGERASSLLGEAMVHVLRQRTEIRSLSQLRGLTTIFLRRIIADRRRRAGVHRRFLAERTVATEPGAAPDNRQDLTADLAESLAALGEFDERKLACLSLSAAHGLSDAEIAETLGISRATVERDLRFARAFVASRLGYRS